MEIEQFASQLSGAFGTGASAPSNTLPGATPTQDNFVLEHKANCQWLAPGFGKVAETSAFAACVSLANSFNEVSVGFGGFLAAIRSGDQASTIRLLHAWWADPQKTQNSLFFPLELHGKTSVFIDLLEQIRCHGSKTLTIDG